MKKVFAVCVLCLLLLWLCVSAGAKEWQQGGTLHEATIAQWKRASYDNKLATCADWISALYLRGNLDINISDFNDIKGYANALVEYIDSSSKKTKALDNETANSVALIGMMLAGWVKNSDTSLSNTKPSKPFKPLEAAENIDAKLKDNGFLIDEEIDEIWEKETTPDVAKQLSDKQKKAIVAEFRKAQKESEESSKKFGASIEDSIERSMYQDGVCKNKVLKATRAIAKKYGIKAGDVVVLADED